MLGFEVDSGVWEIRVLDLRCSVVGGEKFGREMGYKAHFLARGRWRKIWGKLFWGFKGKGDKLNVEKYGPI